MNIPKFTFKLPEPQIPPEVPEEFKEYIKRQNAMSFLPMYFDYLAPTISFEKFKEILGKNRKSTSKPENVYPFMRTKMFDMVDEYLKDDDNEQ